jgi:hypothetical protein
MCYLLESHVSKVMRLFAVTYSYAVVEPMIVLIVYGLNSLLIQKKKVSDFKTLIDLKNYRRHKLHSHHTLFEKVYNCSLIIKIYFSRQLVKLKTPTNRRQYGNDKLFYNDTNVILVSADNESKRQLESRSGGRYLIRTTCGACSANYRQDGMAMDCIAHEKVYEKCSSLTNYVGGELACDSLGTICCCKVGVYFYVHIIDSI